MTRSSPVRHGEHAHQAIPDSRLEIFDQVGHPPQLEAPEQFVAVLERFLEQTEPAQFDSREWREMPGLEWAAPAPALAFAPVLTEVNYPWAALRLISRIAAVLPGVLLGPIAPAIGQRRVITGPALVLGHGIDLIHSFSDATRLARQLPGARLIRTRTAPLTGLGSGSVRSIERFLTHLHLVFPSQAAVVPQIQR